MVALHAHRGEWCLYRLPIAVSKPTSRYLLYPLASSYRSTLPLQPSSSRPLRGRSPQSTRSGLIAFPSHSLLN